MRSRSSAGSIAAFVIVVVAGAGCADSASTASSMPIAEVTTTTMSEYATRVAACREDVTKALTEAAYGTISNDPARHQAALDSIRLWHGTESPEWAMMMQFERGVTEAGFAHGYPAVAVEAAKDAARCADALAQYAGLLPPASTALPGPLSNSTVAVQPSTSDSDAPSATGTVATTSASVEATAVGQPVPGVGDTGLNTSWWLQDYSPAPDFLVAVNDRWGSGEVPQPYADCALPGSLSAPADWGQTGEVTLARDSVGWTLHWPGDFGQYITVLSSEDVQSEPVYATISSSPGVEGDGYTVWPAGTSYLLHLADSTCWFAWGVSPDAPLGAQRAFLDGMRFMESTSAAYGD